jgi:hypothetical protein
MYADAIRQLNSAVPVATDDVRRWIDSGDLLTWSAVYELLEANRVDPPLAPEQQVEFMRRYLLRCILENPTPGETLHGGYEAAWELASKLKQWRLLGGRVAASIRGIAIDLDRIYRRGDDAARNRVLCGVMEHAFEDPAVRPYFADWERDPEMREVYRLAVEWGAAHEQR